MIPWLQPWLVQFSQRRRSLGASVSTIAIREEAILEPLVQEPGLSHLGALSLQAHMTNGDLAGHDLGLT